MKKRSFTLIEVVVGVIILAMTFGGLFTAFVAARQYIEHADLRLVSVNLARKFLDDLYDGVGADKWDNTSTELGLGADKPLDSFVIDDFNFSTNSYNVTSAGTHAYRQATISIDLSEASSSGNEG